MRFSHFFYLLNWDTSFYPPYFFWIFSGIVFIIFLRAVLGKKGRGTAGNSTDTSATGFFTGWGHSDNSSFNTDNNPGGFDGYSGGDGGGGGASGDWSDSGGSDSGGGDGGDGGGD